MVDKLHKYFERKSTEWCLTGFLDACEVEPFERKIDQYLRCLTTIAEGEEGRRKERAEKLLLDYREASKSLSFVKNIDEISGVIGRYPLGSLSFKAIR